jgi:hypothetical protein
MIPLRERSCIIFSFCLVSHEADKANKMCLTEICGRVRVGKNLSDLFPIRNGWMQGDALSPLLLNFVLE